MKLKIRCNGNLNDGACNFRELGEGYCKRHHPETRIKALERQIERMSSGPLWQQAFHCSLLLKESELKDQKALLRAINEEEESFFP